MVGEGDLIVYLHTINVYYFREIMKNGYFKVKSILFDAITCGPIGVFLPLKHINICTYVDNLEYEYQYKYIY